MIRDYLLIKICAIAVIGLLVQPGEAKAVNCTPGPDDLGDLQNEINSALPFTQISVSGTCSPVAGLPGRVTIFQKDNITLFGAAGNGTDTLVGTVDVVGSRNTNLTNLTVRDANTNFSNSGNGITVFQAGGVSLSNVTVKDNDRIGVAVFDQSFLSVLNSKITNNGRQGVLANGGSRVTAFGSEISHNTREGVSLFHAATLSVGVSGSTPTKINDNDREGIAARLASSVFIAGRPNAKIEIKNNGSDGDREGLDLSTSTAQIDDVTISGNVGRPVAMFDGSILSVTDSTIESDIADDLPNTGGMLVNRGSILRLGGNNTISNIAAAPGGTAISIAGASSFRSSRIGTRPKDIITSDNGRALTVSGKSYGDLRNFEINGLTRIINQSTGRFRRDPMGDINGDIEVTRDSAVSFVLTPPNGSVQVTGTVVCTDTESSADLADQTAADIVGGNGKELKCSGYGPGNSKP